MAPQRKLQRLHELLLFLPSSLSPGASSLMSLIVEIWL